MAEIDHSQHIKIIQGLRAENISARTLRKPLVGNLDGSIKKNTSFIKKLKAGITSASVETLSKELCGLKLEKYIEEIADAIALAQYKQTQDVMAAVRICSILHQRNPGFTEMFMPLLMRQFELAPAPSAIISEQKEREEFARISKQRNLLRFLIELYLVGFAIENYDGKQKEELVPGVLNELVIRIDKFS